MYSFSSFSSGLSYQCNLIFILLLLLLFEKDRRTHATIFLSAEVQLNRASEDRLTLAYGDNHRLAAISATSPSQFPEPSSEKDQPSQNLASDLLFTPLPGSQNLIASISL